VRKTNIYLLLSNYSSQVVVSKEKLHIECPHVDNLLPKMINDSMFSNVTGKFQKTHIMGENPAPLF